MATGRTLDRWLRLYSDGYDLSGYARQLSGGLKWEYETQADASWTDAVKNTIACGRATLGGFTLNAFFDNTATLGPHVTHYGQGVKRVVMIAKGIRAAPAQGDPVYCGEFDQLAYQAAVDSGIAVASIPFGEADAVSAAIAYSKPWGALLAPLLARTAVNASAGVDGSAQTTKGGYLCYQITAWNGTGNITISVDDSANNADFLALSGATSGAIAHTAGHTAGVIALATTATVRQYTRWQIALAGGLVGATFALAFVRGQ